MQRSTRHYGYVYYYIEVMTMKINRNLVYSFGVFSAFVVVAKILTMCASFIYGISGTDAQYEAALTIYGGADVAYMIVGAIWLIIIGILAVKDD